MNKKNLALFIMTFFVLNRSSAMQTTETENTKEEKNSIKLKINISLKEALEKGREYYTQKNYDLAYQYFKYAAKRDFVEAQLEYATMLFDGYGCEQDLVKALEIVNVVIKKTAAKKDNNIDFKHRSRYIKTLWHDIINLFKKKNISKKDDDIDFKNIYRVAKTLWHDIVFNLILELMEPVDIEEAGGLLSALLGGGDQDGDDEKEPEMSEAVRSMFV